MQDTPSQAWLRPTLLERLTDHGSESPRSPGRADRVDRVDDASLRELLRRDLTWLLNTTHLAAGLDLGDYPRVAASILNYGVPDLTGRTLSPVKIDALERELCQALLRYESRLMPETLRVHVSSAPSESGRPSLFIEIAAVLCTEPLPVRLRVRAEVDVESGRVALDQDLFEEGDR